MPLNFIVLFVGVIYLSVGFIQAGFTTIKHVEDNKDAYETIFSNDHFLEIIIKHS